MSLFKTIVVKEATDKGKTIKIVDQDKLKFTLWKTKATGGINPSFEAFQQSGGVGANLIVEYVEKPASFTGQDGNLVEYTDRTIYSINKGGQADVATPTTAPVTKGQLTPKEEKMTKEDWEKKDEQKRRDILLQVAFKAAVEMIVADGAEASKRIEAVEILTLIFHNWLLSQTEGQKPQHPVSPGSYVSSPDPDLPPLEAYAELQ